MTRINHETMEALLKYKFPSKTSLPLKLILYVIRKTWGFNKKTDKISLTQFQKATNSGRANVVHWLKYLVSARILVSASEPGGTIYGFNKDNDAWVVSASELVSVPRNTGFSKRTRTSIGAETHKRNIKEITKETQEAFEKFWKAYPRHENRQGALKAFQKVDVPLNTLLEALEKHKGSAAWQKDSGQFIPHPATWLNQRRWEDEITTPQKAFSNIPIIKQERIYEP